MYFRKAVIRKTTLRFIRRLNGNKMTGRVDIVDNGKVINDVLVRLFNEIWQLEKNALITEEFKDLTYNDMHIIEAVGTDVRKMSDIAASLRITVGSLTTSMNSLVKKGYTERERSGKDRRVVFIRLTAKGRRAYDHHAEFHRQMTEKVMQALSGEELQALTRALTGLVDFFEQYR